MRRATLFVIAVVLVALAVVVNPDRAYACSCTGISTRRAFEQSEAAFLGRVVRVDQVGRGDDRRVDIRFEVDRVFKGTVYREQIVASASDSAACGLVPKLGSTWVIFAVDAVEGDGSNPLYRLRTTLCSGNQQTSTVPPGLGAGAEPRAGASDREERATNTDAALTRGLVIAGLGVLGLFALVGIGLAYLWRPSRRAG